MDKQVEEEIDGLQLSANDKKRFKLLYKNFQDFIKPVSPFAYFKSYSLLKNLPRDLRKLCYEEKYGEAVMKYGTNCCGEGCKRYHPIFVIISADYVFSNKKDDTDTSYRFETFSYFFPRFYQSFLFSCKCLTDDIKIFLIEKLMSLFGKINYYEKFPELSHYFKMIEDQDQKTAKWREEYSITIEFLIKNYRRTHNLELVDKIIAVLDSDPSLFKNLYMQFGLCHPESEKLFINTVLIRFTPKQKEIFLASLSPRSRCVAVYEVLRPYMTQNHRNERLWCLFEDQCFASDIKRYEEALPFGGDLYSTDDYGNPWIVCLLGQGYWNKSKTFTLPPNDTILSLVDTRKTNSEDFVNLALKYDNWRVQTHCNRGEKFRSMTKTFLLSTRRAGYKFPITCVDKILKYVVVSQRGTLEESLRIKAAKIRLAVLYLHTYAFKVRFLAIFRDLDQSKVKKIVAQRGCPFEQRMKFPLDECSYSCATLLAEDVCQRLLKEGSLFKKMAEMEELCKTNAKSDAQYSNLLLEKLGLNYYGDRQRDYDMISTHLLLAFNTVFGVSLQ